MSDDESKIWKWTKVGGKILYELTPVADAQHLYEGLRDGHYGEAAFSAFNLATTLVPIGKVAKLAKLAKVAKEAEAVEKAAKEAQALEKAAREIKQGEEAAQVLAKEEQAAKAAKEAKQLEEAAKPANKVEKSVGDAKATQSAEPPGECIPCKLAAAKQKGAVLSIRKPKILSRTDLLPEERALLEKQWRYKSNALKNAAERGELKWSPGTEDVRISQLQRDYRQQVVERYERRFKKKLDISRLDADHPVDMIVGGSPDQQFKLLDKSINRSVGSSLRKAGEKQGLKPGTPISEIRIEE